VPAVWLPGGMWPSLQHNNFETACARQHCTAAVACRLLHHWHPRLNLQSCFMPSSCSFNHPLQRLTPGANHTSALAHRRLVLPAPLLIHGRLSAPPWPDRLPTWHPSCPPPGIAAHGTEPNTWLHTRRLAAAAADQELEDAEEQLRGAQAELAAARKGCEELQREVAGAREQAGGLQRRAQKAEEEARQLREEALAAVKVGAR
jgi:hypothetical protein